MTRDGIAGIIGTIVFGIAFAVIGRDWLVSAFVSDAPAATCYTLSAVALGYLACSLVRLKDKRLDAETAARIAREDAEAAARIAREDAEHAEKMRREREEHERAKAERERAEAEAEAERVRKGKEAERRRLRERRMVEEFKTGDPAMKRAIAEMFDVGRIEMGEDDIAYLNLYDWVEYDTFETGWPDRRITASAYLTDEARSLLERNSALLDSARVE